MSNQENINKEHFDWLVAAIGEKLTKPNSEFLDLLKRLHSRDAQTSDGALFDLLKCADEFPQEIIVALETLSESLKDRAAQNNYSHNWYYVAMIDGLVHIRQKEYRQKIHSILWHEIHSIHPEARLSAVITLGSLGRNNDKEARKILWNARSTKFDEVEETTRFQEAVMKALGHDE
jgi:hypothetical protein